MKTKCLVSYASMLSYKTFVIIDNYVKADWTEIEQGFVPKKQL